MSASASDFPDTSSPTDIAIIGMSGRFPGAPDLNAYWENLCGGVESITRFSREELAQSGVSEELLNDPDYVPAKPMLDDIDQFDAKFFGFNRREAELLDPQHRLFLECVWESLEVAGYNPDTYPGLIGLYAGSTLSSYLLKNLFTNPDVMKSNDLLQLLISNDKDHLTTKTSYKLNLKGPSISASTACSTSLVAVQTAYQSLLSYQCDIAIAGGVSVTVPGKEGYVFKEGGILSPDGHCRAFDADAKGTVFGNGLGVVVLKRLQDAKDDGDTIHAVIKGAAINNDGADKIGYTAPSVNGQAEVIAEALGIADVDPETIGYVEAHGTGTTLGDPIEIRALNKAYGLTNPEKNSCVIGSVKTNIGHLDSAAGIASLIKAVFALKHKVIPPTLNFTKPNPEIDFENSPFYVNTELTRWERKAFPRRAGVSSFGVGGTNAHIILEEAPEPLPNAEATQEDRLLILSAMSEQGLEQATENLANYLETHPQADLDKLAYTFCCGRKDFHQRRSLVFKDLADLKTILAERTPSRMFSQKTSGASKPVTFMFSGQGSQYINMARGLYDSEPAFHSHIESCLQLVDAATEQSLRSVLLVTPGSEAEATTQLGQTALAQPAIFIVEYALAQLCIEWGIKPENMVGHSLGEYVAACLSNVISLQDALDLIIFRGKLIQELPAGSMLAVSLSEKEAGAYLTDSELSLAAINGPRRCVISGSDDSIDRLIQTLTKAEVPNQKLHTSHAFHSSMMDSILEPFRTKLASIALSAPGIPYLSNVTGTWILPEEATDPEYWVKHLRNTVRFSHNLDTLFADKEPGVLLEIGPGNVLTALATQHSGRPSETLVVNTLPSPKEAVTDSSKLLTALGKLWLNGTQIQWKTFFKNRTQGRIPLPTYPFERQSYWIAANAALNGGIAGLAGGSSHSPSTTIESIPIEDDAVQNAETQAVDSDTPITDFILKTIQEKCGINGEIDPGVSFMELGIDSLTLVQINKEILNRFRVKIPFRQLLETLPTPTAVAGHIREKAPNAAKAPKRADRVQPVKNATKAIPETSKELVKHGPFKPVKLSANSEISPQQKDYLDELIARYNKRTSESKSFTETYRPTLTDSRAVVGFRQIWKELVYPIVIEKAKDARIWDLNGNEYVDLIMGFGVNFFGHSPQFVTDAIQEQLTLQPPMVAPQIALAGKTAKLFCELTKHETAAFCNTGSEAVMTALRIARMSTGRDKVVMFRDSYHGNFDGVLGRSQNSGGQNQTVPIVDGVTGGSVEDLVILDYATAGTLEYIEENLEDFAAILIEPVQSRHPEIQPATFIRKIRELTQDSETIMIMDEVVCGFRLAQGGAQEYFGVKADIATYGKIVGGGMPIGVVAGQAKYLDGLDGGPWNYGDASFPEADQTYSAGTFTKHPFALAAAWAVLNVIKEESPQLYIDLNAKAERFANNINALFQKLDAPIHLDHCGSILYFRPNADFSWFELFSYLMVERGISIWGERPYYLTVSHTEADLALIIEAAESAILSLKKADFINPQSTYRFATENVPLTEAQKEVWLASQLEDDASRSYNTTAALRLNGPLNIDALKSSLKAVLKRHEALRAKFDIKGEFQSFNAALNVEIPILDISQASAEDQQAEVEKLLKAEQTNAFDLTNGPLFRAQLVRFNEESHLFAFSLHHIVCDGFSNDIVLEELFKLYTASVQGDVADLPEAMRFSTYAKEVNHHASADYWLGKYADEVPVLELPTDFNRPPLRTYQGARSIRTIQPELYERLRSLAAKQNTSLFNLVYSAFSVLISRLSGQNDVVIGIPVAGQIDLENDCLVGHCANLLPLRNHAAHDLAFADYLKTTSKEVADAFENHRYTFSTLVKKIGMLRDPSRSPLVSVTFNIDRQASTMEFADLTVDCINVPRDFIPFDLMFDLADSGKSLEVKCDYNTSLFCEETIQRWLQHFICLLDGITNSPSRKLGEISLLSAEEERKLIEDFNDTESAFPQDTTVVELFGKQVAQNPDSPALDFEGSKLSYAELNAKAEQLACILRDAGIRPESKVGICIERSHEMMIGIFAILKAGGAYVPIDPHYPSDRIDFVIQDAELSIVLTQAKFRTRITETRSTNVFCLDEEWPTADTQVKDLMSDQAGPENLAYIIYTSGSTGTPKGVQIEHRSLVNRLHWMNRSYPLGAEDIILQKTPFTFDVSVWELFWWSLHGGQLHLLTPSDEKYPEAIIEAIQTKRITKMHFVPSMLEGFLQYIEAGNSGDFSSLREVFTSGEALGRGQAGRFIRLIGKPDSVGLHNLYGPTEATIDVSYFDCVQFEGYSSVPIGKPIDNTQLYVLDSYGSPMPIGLKGELHIGGVNLARGYLNRPELNTEKFIPNPFSSDPNARLYKTGDLAYWLPDGNIAYVGRIDNQVKLRGLRIELGEIESALRQHPEIKEAIVLVKEIRPGNKQINGYLIAKQPIGNQELRDFLSQKLPDYMVPAAFVFIDAIPLTSSGKANHKVLLALETAEEEKSVATALPETDAEKVLAGIWEEVMQRSQIGIHDNFFSLGGDSILAIQIVLRAKDAGYPLTPKQMFEHPTIAQLATVTKSEQKVDAEQGKVTGEVPPTAIQKWFLESQPEYADHFNQSLIFKVSNTLDCHVLEQALRETFTHHDALRLQATRKNSKWKLEHSDEVAPYAFHSIDLSGQDREEQGQQIESAGELYQSKLNLAKGPIAQVIHFNLGEGSEDRLLIIVHHLVMDGVSWRVLVEDLQTAYQQISEKQPVKLPEKTSSFKQWAERINEHTQSTDHAEQIGFWNKVNAQAVPTLQPDFEETANNNLVASEARVKVQLDAGETKRFLNHTLGAYDLKFNDVLLAALLKTFQTSDGASAIRFDLEGHGRESVFNDLDVSRTIGWFTTLFPVTLEESESTPEALLTSVKKQLAEFQKHGVSYGQLLYLGSHSESPITSVKSDIVFNYLGQLDNINTEGQLLKLTREAHGSAYHPARKRTHALEIECAVLDGCLSMEWVFSTDLHKSESIEKLAQAYCSSLKNLIDHCASITPASSAKASKALAGSERFSASASDKIQPLSPEIVEHPLSFAQERLWFLNQLDQESIAYHIQASFSLEGSLDFKALQNAINDLLQRQECFRAVFTQKQEEPQQTILEECPVDLQLNDLSEQISHDPIEQIRTLAAREMQKPFNLGTGPLLRLLLVRLPDIEQQKHVLIITTHHIISDGWSNGIFARELAAFYDARLTGKEPDLPRLPVKYTDYVAWQRQHLRGSRLEEQVGYWKSKLEGAPSRIALPLDYARPARQTYQGSMQAVEISADLTRKLRALSQQAGGTLYMSLLATFNILLHRLSGQNDIVIGSPVAGRNHRETEGLIGLFVNTLAFRTQLDTSQNYRTLQKQVRDNVLEAFSMQELPFEKLVEELQPERNLSYNPVFQVFFNMLNFDKRDVSLAGIKVQPVDIPEIRTIFDLTLYAIEKGDSVRFEILYNTSLFSAERIALILDQWVHLLEQTVDAPEAPIGNYTLSKEKCPSLESLPNISEAPTAPYSSLETVLHPHLESRSEQIALTDATSTWTYKELEAASNQLAHYLQKQRIGENDVVAIYSDRCSILVCSLLGTIKSGAAFLILDSQYPAARNTDILAQAKPKCFVAIGENNRRLPPEIETILRECSIPTELRLVLSDKSELLDLLKSYSEDFPTNERKQDSLGYLAFTSGTTGKTQGITATLEPLSRFIQWHVSNFRFKLEDRFSMLSGLAHDPLLRDIFAPLNAGARLCIPQQSQFDRPTELSAWFENQEITVSHLTPSLSDMLLLSDIKDKGSPHFPELRYAFFGGEALKTATAQRLFNQAPLVQCFNGYGCTETPQIVALHSVSREAIPVTPVYPIGQGVNQTELLILNTQGELAGIGEVGEICIYSPLLSQGYLDNDSLTQARFVADPFAENSSYKLYKTGDLGRYNLTKDVEYLGRRDGQINLRGNRIELQEIEVALSKIENINEACVVLTGEEDAQLIAYVTVEGSSEIEAIVRQHLAAQLPPYMLPQDVIRVEALPRTPNGKIDIPELRKIRSAKTAAQQLTLPEQAVEKCIAEIWQMVLGVDTVYLENNFFALGGHSLKAAQVFGRLQQALGISVSLRLLFEEPTLKDLAERVAGLLPSARFSSDGNSKNATEATIQRQPEMEHYPVSHAQRRLWVLTQMEEAAVAFNMPRALILTGPLDIELWEKSLHQLLQKHESLRTRFALIDGEPRQLIDACEPSQKSLQMVDLSDRENPRAAARQLAETDAQTPFDLQKGPLFRMRLLKLGPNQHVVLFNLHHIISDGWSMGVIVKDFMRFYENLAADGSAQFEPLPISYRDYALFQQTDAHAGALKTQADYWHHKLSGPPAVLQLPLDFPRPPVKTYAGKRLKQRLPAELTEQLNQLCQSQQVTLFTILLSSVKTLLFRYSGQEDIVVGSPIAGRNYPELENQIGFYVNTLPLRTELQGDQPFSALLHSVQQTVTEAFDHQDYPFDKLVDELGIQRDTSRHPLFDVAVVLQNTENAELAIEGLELNDFEEGISTTKYDLSFTFEQIDGVLFLDIDYNTDLFNTERIQLMASHVQALFISIIGNSDLPLQALNILGANERERLLHHFNDTDSVYPENATIIDLFDESAGRNPDNIAVVVGNSELTYNELVQQANAVASKLHQEHQIKLGDFVGIRVERSAKSIVGILGILKAGAAYVPIDPLYPEQRQSFIAEDSGAVAIIDESFIEAAIATESVDFTRQNDPDSPAYVIYTSGSTGKPKGCVVTQRNVVRLMRNHDFRFSFSETDVWVAAHSFCFDFSVWEMYGALLNGGRLIIAQTEEVRNIETFHALIKRHKVSILNQTPAAFYNFIQIETAAPEHTLKDHLRYVIFGGDRLETTYLKDWSALYSLDDIELINMYGITETTVHVTFGRITDGDVNHKANNSPIGVPLPETRVYVCDPALNLQPIGVPGELYVGGTGVSNGYLNRPELTAERFIKSPFESGDTLYRTGDLGVWLADGTLDFLGRNDNQVQIRGYRIELGEIENAITKHPDVEKAVVVPQKVGATDDQLIAYFTIKQESPDLNTLRKRLNELLPDYMIPAQFIEIAKIPLTSNGKVDKQALPDPNTQSKAKVATHQPPQNELQQAIAGVWKSVLKRDNISISDNFFEIGGNSLLIVQIQRGLKDVLPDSIPVVQLFRHPTIASLAEYLSKDTTDGSHLEGVQDRVKKQKEALKRRRSKTQQ